MSYLVPLPDRGDKSLLRTAGLILAVRNANVDAPADEVYPGPVNAIADSLVSFTHLRHITADE
jgi:hypothetical protein